MELSGVLFCMEMKAGLFVIKTNIIYKLTKCEFERGYHSNLTEDTW